ncbi:glycosyltransferase family 2 protein [Cloacibacillus evryensis]|uniref:Glycosyltransferase n=1 Tax=Cloacibacillus evryensis TaxID=508460 RepID=A0AAW5KBP5_9BACT|nr:glycosyltransferase family 2 protein [Cloacibacillus evryensis]EHL63734.1 hypothetical protein HMPREF1006_01115 [Synergistes sp. 3_1_syn1]MCQ4815218.1 glycosyltransferase [Cloacibacillus evryensis]
MSSKIDLLSLPIVSVIIATFRRKAPLKRALESLCAQTYSSDCLEIIIVDDNDDKTFTDDVLKIVDYYRTLININYIKNPYNMGSAASRNVGIESSFGEYITFLDDDDVYLPEKITRQVDYMLATNADFCISDIDLYDEDGNLVEKRTRRYLKDFTYISLIKSHVMYHMAGTDTFMFRSKYLQKIGGFSGNDVGDDFYLMEKAINNKGIFVYLPFAGTRATVHAKEPGMSSGHGKIKGEKKLFEYKKKKYFKLLSLKEKRFVIMRHYLIIAYAYWRSKRYFSTLCFFLLSFSIAPAQCIYEIYGIKNRKKEV